ncbi:MAG: alpha-ketoglutarate-dependent dioxygenase AlkB [Archangium sp.]
MALNNCLCNLYESGANSMGFHFDSYARLAPGSFIAIASFGTTRTLTFRSLDRTPTLDFPLESGSLFLMSRAPQNEWMHAIRRDAASGPRISCTFRQLQSAACASSSPR